MYKKKTFTLAEVLIVIGVIGVVAAITIPTLINTISEKAKKSQTEVIEKRLLDGLNRFSTMDDGFSQKYNNTYEFLEGLSKHYKMSQICDTADIRNCIPYSKISYTADDETGSIDVSSLTSIESFMPEETAVNYLEPASFISAQGTPFIAALKKDCVRDTGKAMIDINGSSTDESGCLALMYDKNGTGLPNKLNNDIVSKGLTIMTPDSFWIKFAGLKISAPFIPEKLYRGNYCTDNNGTWTPNSEASAAGVNVCCTNCTPNVYRSDNWASAMMACKKAGGSLPNTQQLAQIASYLYNTNITSNPTSAYSDLTLDTTKEGPLSGLKNQHGIPHNFDLWSNSPSGSDKAFTWLYTQSRYSTTGYQTLPRDSGSVYAICIK